MNKRILCLMMVLAMVLSLFACGKSPDSEELAELDTEVGISGESQENGESEGEEKPSQKPSETPDQPTGNDEGEEQKPSEENKEEKDPAQSENKPSEEKEPSAETEQKPQQEKPKEEGKDKLSHLINDTSGTKLKILCQNLRYHATEDLGSDNYAGIRRYRFQVLMDKYDPDVVGLQECDKGWIEYLQQDYGSEYTMFYQYRGSTSGSDEASPVMWKTDKYKMVDSGYFWLSDTPDVSSASFIKGTHPRIVTWVKLKDLETGQSFNIYSTHFGFYEEDAHIDRIRNLITKSFRTAGEYSFIMGDFNIAYEDDQYWRLMQTNLLGDLRPVSEAMAKDGVCELGDIRNGAYNAFKYPDGGVFGDFIMAKPHRNLAVDHFGYCYERPAVPEQNIEEGFVSDHFAVYAEVRMGTKQSYEKYWGVF